MSLSGQTLNFDLNFNSGNTVKFQVSMNTELHEHLLSIKNILDVDVLA